VPGRREGLARGPSERVAGAEAELAGSATGF
jgi:hypothetical protein